MIRQRSAWLRRLGAALAAALVALAVVFAFRGSEPGIWLRAEPIDLAALAGLVLVNLAAGGMLFWVVTRCFDTHPPVSAARMIELIAASSLLNYIPVVRAGLVGRTAYLRARHGLPIAQSVVILGTVAAVAAAVGAASLLVLIGGVAGYAAFAAALVALTFVTPALAGLLRRRARLWPLWVPLRVIDLLAASARLWLAFRIIGEPIGFDAALLAGSAALVVKLTGLTPNGLGLSEWAVAGLASALEPTTAAAGAAAALIDRAVEIAVVSVVGVISMWRLRGAEGPALREASGPA